jgi:sortase B
MHIKYSQLKAINPDFVSWLYFPYFEISYPVVHENEIDQYLKTTFDGTPNKAGCLFTDILSTTDFTGMHDIIFGHNMRNGSMFGKLKRLGQTDDRENIKQNPYIYIYTESAVYQYQIFAFYVTTVGSNAYSVVNSDEEYENFLQYISTHNAFDDQGLVDQSDHPSILTLSTCSGSSGSGRRFVIHSAKVNSWPVN